MIKVSAVILSYNRKEDLRDGLEKILSYNLPYLEIIVVDNASNDGTVGMVEKEFGEKVHLIKLKENIGVAAYNIGFEKAKGEYILILDDDSFPTKGAIEKMVYKFDNNVKTGIVALDVRSYEYCKKNNFEVETDNINKNDRADYLIGFNGAGAGFRKEVFKKIGGYPEEHFLYWNEMDLSIRVLNANYKIKWLPGAIVCHKFSPKNRDSERGPFFYTRNLFWIIFKYFPFLKMLGASLKLVYLSFYYSIEQKTFIYLKAMVNAFLNSGRALKKRVKVKKEIIDKIKITYKLAFTIFR